MTVQINVYAFFIALLILLIVIFLIPMMLQLKKTARDLDTFLVESQRELVPMLHELRQASERINRITDKADQGLDKSEELFASLAETGHMIHDVNEFLHRDIGHYVGNAAGMWLGMRAASKVFLKQLRQQKGGD
ncbi:MAG TPA: DUF948 domain-containing protein [Desulfuromonadales bacterium]|nr:DUF948 domain-containing protein [Desulfuromonadales bacterium]